MSWPFAPGGRLEPALSSNRADWQPRIAIVAPLPDPGEVDVPPRDIHACGPRRPPPPRGARLSWTHDPAAALVPAGAPRSPTAALLAAPVHDLFRRGRARKIRKDEGQPRQHAGDWRLARTGVIVPGMEDGELDVLTCASQGGWVARQGVFFIYPTRG